MVEVRKYDIIAKSETRRSLRVLYLVYLSEPSTVAPEESVLALEDYEYLVGGWLPAHVNDPEYFVESPGQVDLWVP